MLAKGDSSNRKKKNGCSFQQVLRQNLSWFLSEHRKTLFLRGFTLNPTEKAKFFQKNGTTDFQNSPPFEVSTYFYVTITGNFESFQYFEISFLKNENLSHKN